MLYKAYVFEMLECGADFIASKKVFIFHVYKVWPKVKVQKITDKSTNERITLYRGIRLLPVDMDITIPKEAKLPEVKEFITQRATDAKIIEEKPNFLKCSLETSCKSNGNNVEKVITFHNNGEWELEISNTKIDLEQIQIWNKYTAHRKGVETVLTAARIVRLCPGVAFTKHIMVTKYQLIENWSCAEGNSSRMIRSILCLRVVPFYVRQNLSNCMKCHKMTTVVGTEKKGDSNDEENQTLLVVKRAHAYTMNTEKTDDGNDEENQTPLNTPENQTPLNTPEKQTPSNTPEKQTPLNTPEKQTPLNMPKEQTTLNMPEEQTTLYTPTRYTLQVENTNVEDDIHVEIIIPSATDEMVVDSDEDETLCVVCHKTIPEASELLEWIQCDNCNDWIHRGCAGLQHHLRWKKYNREGVQFYCKQCDSIERVRSSTASSVNK